jgi:multiple sugar transport system permease protein
MFIVSWHELLIPLILNARPDFMTLPVIIASLVGDVFVFFNLMMAICLLALPRRGPGGAPAEIHRRACRPAP